MCSLSKYRNKIYKPYKISIINKIYNLDKICYHVRFLNQKNTIRFFQTFFGQKLKIYIVKRGRGVKTTTLLGEEQLALYWIVR